MFPLIDYDALENKGLASVSRRSKATSQGYPPIAWLRVQSHLPTEVMSEQGNRGTFREALSCGAFKPCLGSNSGSVLRNAEEGEWVMGAQMSAERLRFRIQHLKQEIAKQSREISWCGLSLFTGFDLCPWLLKVVIEADKEGTGVCVCPASLALMKILSLTKLCLAPLSPLLDQASNVSYKNHKLSVQVIYMKRFNIKRFAETLT